MKSKNTAPTMKDVAQEAGVALGTVSKVFNGIPVGERYKKKVEDAAQKLGYQVNSYARGLRSNKTNTVALILPNLLHPFFGTLAHHVYQSLSQRGYRMLIATTEFDPTTEQECVSMVRQNKVDGIIGLTYNPNLQIDPSLPYVSIDRYLSNAISCVSADNFGGGQLAAKRLVELGCQKLLFFRLGSEISAEPDKRGAGFEQYCQMNKISYHSIYLCNSDGRKGFYQFIEEHISAGKLEYDGIFCSTDHLAYKICKKLQQLGVRVPEDVQIIGFDGLQKFGEDDFFCSTIVQPVQQMAETAVKLLLADSEEQSAALVCLPVTYAAGGTTKDSTE